MVPLAAEQNEEDGLIGLQREKDGNAKRRCWGKSFQSSDFEVRILCYNRSGRYILHF